MGKVFTVSFNDIGFESQALSQVLELPKVIIRYFGIKFENRIEFFLPLFPNFYYLETT